MVEISMARVIPIFTQKMHFISPMHSIIITIISSNILLKCSAKTSNIVALHQLEATSTIALPTTTVAAATTIC